MDWAFSVNTDVPRVVDTARQAMKAQSVDGCWADVQYDDAARSLWKADLHLERLNTLSTAAFALRRGGHPNTELEVAGERAVACWLRRDPQNPNWWWNEIGAPQELGRAALLLQPALNKEDIAGVGRVLRRSVWTRWTGQNLVWGTSIEVLRGLIENDAVVVQEGFERLFDEVRIAPAMTTDGKPGEGVESDGSFHQHGAQLYSGGYGYGFGVDVGRAVVLTWGTRFQVREEPMRVFAHFVLDGQQWMMRGDTFDYLARGREITREEGRRKIDHSDFQRVVSALAELDVPRKSEFARFANALHGGPETAGNRNFWNSDYMVHRRVSYAVSVRMFSTRMQNEEIVNGEGERSVHLADGASMLYLRGDEYRGIFPVWDWSMVPGATALHWLKDGRPQTGELKPVGQMGETDFVGGVSDGEYGAAVMDLKRGTLHAKKAWFFLMMSM
jgi:chondroitin AC lyase